MRHAGRGIPIRLLAAMLAVALASCGDGLSLGPDPASMGRSPELHASASSLELRQAESNDRALELSWSAGSNRGTSAAIDYTLEFDAQDGSFGAPVRVAVGRAVYAKSYTVAQLNALLTDELGVAPGATGAVHVRVRASVAGGAFEPDASNVVTVSAKPYEPVSTTLYLIGSAAPNGWDAGNATPLTPNSALPFVFTYEGNLAPGEFKFITTLGEFLPSYNRDGSDDRLRYRTDDEEPDDKFVVTEPGPYRMTVNLVALTLELQRAPGPPYAELWVVGDATPTGWSLEDAIMMRQDPADPFLFDYNAVLAAGEFKIATAKDWGAPFYRPTSDRPPLDSPEVQLSAGDPDHKWYVAVPGAYKIILDVRAMTISIRPFTPYPRLWMVGDATPAGWNIDNPTEMEADPSDPYVFSWEGSLTEGEFKIPVTTGDWGADYFMPAVHHAPLDDTFVRFIPRGEPDNKWRITEPGRYRITLNQLYQTIRIERQ